MKVRVGHTPLEFKDSNEQHKHDITKIFKHAVDRRWAWITGTEAGPGAKLTNDQLISIGRDHGYKLWVPAGMLKPGQLAGGAWATDTWIAVRKDIISGNWKTGFIPAIPGSAQLYEEQGLKNPHDITPRWGPKGLTNVGFDCDALGGRVNVGAAHPLTDGSHDGPTSVIHGVDHYKWNNKMQKVIGDWGRKVGAGRALAFIGADQNDQDREHDTFRGQPFTSVADELKDYQSTGHGAIDVIASYNHDGRVKALDWNVLDDREFQMYGDHFVCEATFQIDV